MQSQTYDAQPVMRMTFSDDELCRALAEDLVAHFAQLVERFQQRLFAFALRLTGSRQEAEDILQEALLGPAARTRQVLQ